MIQSSSNQVGEHQNWNSLDPELSSVTHIRHSFILLLLKFEYNNAQSKVLFQHQQIILCTVKWCISKCHNNKKYPEKKIGHKSE
jgi:uncharacterized protein YjfI (DUF2170 family)